MTRRFHASLKLQLLAADIERAGRTFKTLNTRVRRGHRVSPHAVTGADVDLYSAAIRAWRMAIDELDAHTAHGGVR